MVPSNLSLTLPIVPQYFLFLLIIFAAQLAAGILAAIYSNEITNYLETEGKDFLEMKYGNNTDEAYKLATQGWDVIQEKVRLRFSLGVRSILVTNFLVK